ncbi:hypothetical protein J3R82DRAFT_603 [Butyriboletus roseoflavus]|nr:hypothetical protein J3R82DRAFT_603 [Butyriboletus roseoflavus]
MVASLQAFILTEHPTPFFSVGELVLATLALGPLPSFVPLVLLLSLLMIHGQRIAHRQTRGRELLCSWISVTGGSALAHWRAVATATSSPSESLTAVVLLSGATYSVVVLSLYLDILLKGRLNTNWAQFTLFPVLWATSWSITSRISPVGRLLNWWPAPVPSPYNWMLPVVGPAGIDWIVAAWAVVCSELVAQWLMGFSEYEPMDTHNNQSLLSSRTKGLLSLATILIALTFPSSVSQSLPFRADVVVHTPLTVGCALPNPLDGSHPSLGDFIDETAKMNAADVILWPESAVVFNSEKEREAAFTQIRGLSIHGFVGVAFDEYVMGDPAHTRNGFALIHKGQKSGDEVVQYYKRNLVPLTESFAKIPSVDPPVITRWQLKNPKGITKPDWAPAPNFTRPLLITSSICLDFTSPTVFTDLDARPSLILGPARTWDSTVGFAMWEQAKARANELGSMVLWCDGGSMGVNGVGGGGIQEPMQIGGGSWMRTIGVPYPFNENRTLYARGGDISAIAFLVALMGGTHNFLQSKLPRGLRGSLRSSTHSFDPSRLLARAFPRSTNLFGRRQSAPAKEPDTPPPDDSSGDFELIASDDVPPHPTTSDHPAVPASSHAPEDHIPFSLCESSVTTPPHPSLSGSRPKSTLFRLKNISKASIHLSSFTDSRASSSRTRTATNESDLCLAFPKPPTHIPTPETSAPGASLTSGTPTQPPESSTLDASTSSSAKHDTFSGGCAVLADPDTTEEEPHTNSGPPVLVAPAGPAKHSPKPVKRRPRFAGSLKRFKSLSQILRDSFVSHPVDASSIDTIRSTKVQSHTPDFESSSASSNPANPSILPVPPVPDLSVNPAHPSSLSFTAGDIESDSPPASISSLPAESSPTPILIPLRRKHSAPAGLGRDLSSVAHYQFVNPSELTASPPSLVRSSFIHSSARSSFLPPSPSWLSRNVTNLDPAEISTTFPPSRISALSDSDHLKIPEITAFYPSALFAPDSPYPLPIPPPLIPVPPPQSRQSTTSPGRPILQPLLTNVYPESPESDTGSFVTSPTPLESTLYSPSSSTTPTTAFASALPSPSPQFRRRLSNITLEPIANLGQPFNSKYKVSLQSDAPLITDFLQDLSVRNQLSNGPKFHLVKAPPSPVTCDDSDHRTIFIPSKPSDSPLSNQSPLPKDLSLLLEAFFIQSGILNSFSRPAMDYTGKNVDVVDVGGEVDYSGHHWFQEPPPRPEPQPAVQPYIPDEYVIKQNEAFDFALKAAPNVLYGRFKQYGQLGVLAWCSEFGEMIDSLKDLGFAGNMFVATRAQALRTCEEILKLKLDIKMQIIQLYLSSQVSRLRRFLDSGERQWDDYPTAEFPLDYRAYSS